MTFHKYKKVYTNAYELEEENKPLSTQHYNTKEQNKIITNFF